MTHMRQQIRTALQTALTGLATTAARVHVNKLKQLRDENLPALVISTGSEQVTLGAARLYSRSLRMTILVLVKQTGDPEQTTNQIIAEIETVLGVGMDLAGAVKKLTLLEISDPQEIDVMDRPVIATEITLEAVYFTAPDNPTISR